MKTRFTIYAITLILLFSFQIKAQSFNRCGTMQYLQQRMQQDPTLAAKMQANEIAIQNEITNLSNHRTASTTYSIPVVVHVVWHTAAEDISNAQVWSQIDALNEDYGRTNADTANTPTVFQSVAANTGIQFCLAQTDPNGNLTNGIEYTQTSVISFPSGGNVTSSSTGGADPWDTLHYLNIWVCNLDNGMTSYSAFPGGAGWQGAVVAYIAFGRTGNVAPPYNKGRTASHAIGHCFNLRHIWGDNNCGDDLVADTPTQQGPNFGCPIFPQVTCSNGPNGDMFMNYMDYTDDACMNMFTQGQKVRMLAAVNVFYSSLISSSSCIPSFAKVKGKVFYDTNQNGLQDINDIGLNAQKIITLPDSNFYFTNYWGGYDSYFDTATVNTVQFVPKPSWLLTSDSASYSVLMDTAVKCCYDFGTAPAVFFDSLEIGVGGWINCAVDNPIWIYYINEGTKVDSGRIKFVACDSLPYVSASPPPAYFSGDTLVWNYINLQPGEYRGIQVIVHGPVSDTLPLPFYAEIDLNNNGNYTMAAADSEEEFEGCSYDPNFKEVKPAGILPQHYTLKNIPFEYTIMFQNTGSANAANVIIRDTLSSLLDRNTFQLMGYSHSVNTSVSSQNIAEFRFNNINLPPESTDEVGSRGFVKFKITPQPGLPDGTVINNHAAIYFDFNAPVITDTVFNTLVTVLPTGIQYVKDEQVFVSVKPIPFKNNFDITVDTKNNKRLFLSVFDATGNIVMKMEKNFSQSNSKQIVQVNSKTWAKGIYFLKISDESGKDFYSGKLVKE